VAVGAVLSDAVLLLRSRPIHSVSAAIEFARPVIDWHVPEADCRQLSTGTVSTSAAGRSSFCLPFRVAFNYSSPPLDPSQHGHCRTTLGVAYNHCPINVQGATGWLGGRVVSVLDSGAEGPGF